MYNSQPCFAGSTSIHSIRFSNSSTRSIISAWLGHTVCAKDEIDQVNGTSRQPMPFYDAINFCG